MRAVFGLFLIFMGLAMAVLWMPAHDSERQLAAVTDIATQGISSQGAPAGRAADRRLTDDRGARSFSPQTPLIARAETTAVASANFASTSQPPSMFETLVGRVTGTDGLAGHAEPPHVPTHVVTSATVIASSAGASPVGRQAETKAAPAASRPTTDAARFELVRGLQGELKRLGCYLGDVDGNWGSGSRRAMSQFTDRINAQLPYDEPDYILLTLLQGQQTTICGKGCPAGQSMADGGRCMPNAVVAQSSRKPAEPGRRSADRDPRPEVASAAGTGLAHALVPPTVTGSTAPAQVIAIAPVAPLPGRMSAGATPGALAPLISPPQPSAATSAVRIYADPAGDGTGLAPPADRYVAAPRDRRPRSAGTYYSRPPRVYRAPPPRYVAAPQVRRSRSWTATFFNGF